MNKKKDKSFTTRTEMLLRIRKLNIIFRVVSYTIFLIIFISYLIVSSMRSYNASFVLVFFMCISCFTASMFMAEETPSEASIKTELIMFLIMIFIVIIIMWWFIDRVYN